ncbi:hypothetical protein [Blattabacterium cuenoti]|uniref:hypothetical protein n=1 Tax=Blattabacterium cuenoti TaxID=1653831 RepID=UPI00163CE127
MKRLIRSSFIENKLILKKYFNKKIYIIFLYKSSVIHNYYSINSSIKKIFNSINLLFK